jgi:hypothetical protein
MATTNLFNALNRLKKDAMNDIACEYISFVQELRPTINKIMSKALDIDEKFANFNSPLEWASDQFKFVLDNELFIRIHIQSHKSVPETKIENQQTTINKQDVNDHFEIASQKSQSYRRSYKLPHKTPMFMPDGRTCDDWFFVFENALDTSGIPDDMHLPLLSNLVKDTALQLLKTYMRDHVSDSNWDDFKQILRNTFQSVDLDYRNRVKTRIRFN